MKMYDVIEGQSELNVNFRNFQQYITSLISNSK